MYPRHLLIMIGAVLGVVFIVVIIKLVQPIEMPSPGFENTKRDSLSEMLSILEEYEDVLDQYDQTSSNSMGDYPDYYEQDVYRPTDEDQYLKSDDTRYLSMDVGILSTVDYVIDSAKAMSIYCFGYTEGETCRYLLQKKWFELYLSDDNELYLNYYIHHKTSFLYERDEWINYELYLYKIDDVVHIDIGINSYNTLTGHNAESAYYFKDQAYLKFYTVYGDQSYQFSTLDLATHDYMTISYSGLYTEASYYNNEDEIYMSFNDFEPLIGFEYQVFLDGEDLFHYSTETEYLRYNLWHVSGWDTLEKQSNDDYILYVNGAALHDITTHISIHHSVTPYMYLQMNTVDMTETIVNLSDYDMEAVIELDDILSARVFYFGEFNILLAKEGLTKHHSSNYETIASYIINNDDSDIVP